jgi:hypothetical protein
MLKSDYSTKLEMMVSDFININKRKKYNNLDEVITEIFSCTQKKECEKMAKIINSSYGCTQKMEYKSINEVIDHFLDCSRKNDWKSYNFLDAFKLLKRVLEFVLCTYGQISKQTFIRINLKIQFPKMTYEDIDNCHEAEQATVMVDNNGKTGLVVIGDTVVDKDGKADYVFELLPTTKKYIADHFYGLKKEFENDPSILNLIEICEEIDDIIVSFNKNIEFSQQEMISVLNKALHSKHPGGPLFL